VLLALPAPADAADFLGGFRIGMRAAQAKKVMPTCTVTELTLPVGCDPAGRCPPGERLWCTFATEKATVAPGVEAFVEEPGRGLIFARMRFEGPAPEVLAKADRTAEVLERKYGEPKRRGTAFHTQSDETARRYEWELSDLRIVIEARFLSEHPEAGARGRILFLHPRVDVPGWSTPDVVKRLEKLRR